MELDTRLAVLRERLGSARVDDLLAAADALAGSPLSGEENVVFGFLQRVLVHVRNQGRSQGMIFPKVDERYRRFFDYFDGDGRITVIVPGSEPGQLRVEADWFRQLDLGPADFPYYEVVPGKQAEIVAAFLEAYSALTA